MLQYAGINNELRIGRQGIDQRVYEALEFGILRRSVQFIQVENDTILAKLAQIHRQRHPDIRAVSTGKRLIKIAAEIT